MRIPRVWIDDPLLQGETCTLPKTTAHHLIHVLRMRVDEPIIAFNGQSTTESHAIISSISKKQVSIAIGEPVNIDRESPLSLALVQAISKGDKMDFTIQKAVEIGINQINPIYSERTIRPFKPDRLKKRLEHWQQIIINACEQSGRTILPTLSEPASFNEMCQNKLPEHHDVLLAPTASHKLTSLNPSKADLIRVWVGPEGGFSDNEIDQALNYGFKTISLGPRILRTETAGLAALSVLQNTYGDW